MASSRRFRQRWSDGSHFRVLTFSPFEGHARVKLLARVGASRAGRRRLELRSAEPRRAAANGRPSSLRQIPTTSRIDAGVCRRHGCRSLDGKAATEYAESLEELGAFASVSTKSSTIAVTRSTNNCTAGKTATSAAVSFPDGCGLLSGPSRYSLSPATPSGSLLVAKMLTPGAPLSSAATKLAAASMTRSQLSSSSSIRLSFR